MTDFDFVIPSNTNDLLQRPSSEYCVEVPFSIKELPMKLAEARRSFKSEGFDSGINYILDKDNFNAYYSVLYHINKATPDVIFQAYNDLQEVVLALCSDLSALLGDKDCITDEMKLKNLNLVKMIVYLFSQFIIHFEDGETTQAQQTLNKRNKPKSTLYTENKSKGLLALGNLINLDIQIFWEPPVIEETFISLISNVCFSYLRNPAIKNDKQLRIELFNVLGALVKSHNYGQTLALRLVQSVRSEDHLSSTVVPEGIKLMAERYQCSGLVKHLMREITEWQVKEEYQDTKGAKNCNNFLTEMATLMPQVVFQEMDYLTSYLSIDVVPLRCSVLTILTEILDKCLTKPDLTDDERNLREELFDDILDHLHDISASVRACVIQNITKLQTSNAIPMKLQENILTLVVCHLRDKGAPVRKAAIHCIKTFLSHNPYGIELQLTKIESKLVLKTEELNKLEEGYRDAKAATLNRINDEWNELEKPLKEALSKYKLIEEDEDEDDDANEDDGDILDLIRNLLKERKFAEVVKLVKKSKELRNSIQGLNGNDQGNDVEVFLFCVRSIYIRLPELMIELRTRAGMSDEDMKRIEVLEKDIKFYTNCVSFLRILDSTIEPMKELLLSVSIADMKEAIQFFIAAHNFQIDNASQGILAMLELMKVKEQERKEAIVEAFRTIYLTTNSKTMNDHTVTVTNGLIRLIQEIPIENIDDVQEIISQWTANKVIDNNVINQCWEYFMRKSDVTETQARGACEILRMTSLGRNSIILRNIKTVTAVAFTDYGKDNLLYLSSACRFLAVAGRGKININAKEPPTKIHHSDQMFEDLIAILAEKFFDPFYSYFPEVLESSIDMIYLLCGQPNAVCEALFSKIIPQLTGSDYCTQVIVNLCSLLGIVAINLLSFLDSTVYLELKRRNNIRDGIREKNLKRKSVLNNMSILETFNTTTTVLEGAEATDHDADFILEVLDQHVVCGSGLLGQFVDVITTICQNPVAYDDIVIQGNAVKAFMRFMLVSQTFCTKNIKLLFTILAKTQFPKVKCSILLHCSDLLTRFPNVIEPWTQMIYISLRDDLIEVRKVTLFTLGNLILRDMVRAHNHIAEIAFCLTDQCVEISSMCKKFFDQLARKDNNLVNVIPDIFTCLNKKEVLDEAQFEFIMKFLFELVDTTRRMENLVDRFCCKYATCDDLKHQKRLTYCLSLITYNDKALRKLQEKFPVYRHLLQEQDIYDIFKEILAECSKVKVGKVDLKPIVDEIETLFDSVFELDPQKRSQRVNKTKAKPKARTKRRNTSNKRKQRISSDSDSD